jgi:RHS repeat-associated protein
VGFQFTVAGTALTVTDLGRWVVSGNSGNHEVKLFYSDGTPIPNASVTVSTAGKPAGQFAYATLTSPVILAAGTTYAVMSREYGGGDWWHDYAGTQITLTAAASGAWSVWAYPTPPPYYGDLNGAGKSHGPVGLKYLTSGSWTLASETRYVYDGMLVIQERNSGNTPTVTYTRGLDLSATLQGAGGIGGLLARSHGYVAGTGAWSYHNFYHADAGGNITAMADNHATSASLVASYRYDPFGRIFYQSGTLASANVYRFSSKEQMPNSGLYYYGFRFYDPLTQRWLNRDPIGEAGGVNLYALLANNPVNEVDWLGLAFGNPIPDIVIGPQVRPPRDPDPSTWDEFCKILKDPDGYTACYARCMLGLTVAKGGNELGIGKELGRRYYTAKYPKKFKAGGRHSKVMVPRFAARLSGALAALTIPHVLNCIQECWNEGEETGPMETPVFSPPYSGGPVNAPPALVISL